jgi:hypothetical protein
MPITTIGTQGLDNPLTSLSVTSSTTPTAGSRVDFGGNTRVRRTFPFNVNATPVQWTRLGTVSIFNGTQVSNTWGGGCIIRVLGTFGFNALDAQLGYTEIVMYGSNNNTPPNNINGKFSHTGRSGSQSPVLGVKARSVNGVQFDNLYEIWVQSSFYTPNTMIEVTTSDGWIWTWDPAYGTLTTADPGPASNTLRVFKNKSPSFGAAAYARIRGSDAAILESYNVSSTSKNGADFTITFSQPMSDSAYTIVGSSAFNVGINGNIPLTINTDGTPGGNAPNENRFLIRLTDANPTFFCVVVFSNY